MKKYLLIVILLFTFASVVSASSINGDIDGHPIVNVIYDGEVVNVEETPAFIYGGNTMVPIKMLREMGFTVEWVAETYSVVVTPPEPVVIVQEPTVEETVAEPVTTPQTTTGTVTESVSEPTAPTTDTVEEPTVEPEPTTSEKVAEEPAPVVDNTAACQDIHDQYASDVAALNYKGYNQGKIEYHRLILEFDRDKALEAAGCN